MCVFTNVSIPLHCFIEQFTPSEISRTSGFTIKGKQYKRGQFYLQFIAELKVDFYCVTIKLPVLSKISFTLFPDKVFGTIRAKFWTF